MREVAERAGVSVGAAWRVANAPEAVRPTVEKAAGRAAVAALRTLIDEPGHATPRSALRPRLRPGGSTGPPA